MKSMPAGQFKARCLRVMEQVKKYRVPVVITKKGRPVAKLVPVDVPSADIFGCMAGTAKIVGDIESPILAAGAWKAVGRTTARRTIKRTGSQRRAR